MAKHGGILLLRGRLRPNSALSVRASKSSRLLRRQAHNPADNPDFISVVDNPPQIISTKKKDSVLGLLTLALIPFTAFCLGSWQVQRLDWKTKLIAKFEDRLVKPPLPLPPRIDLSAIDQFDYRRVYATGKFRHDKEMLIGPRMHDGNDGFLVVTPLERPDGANTILVNRGWIKRDKQYHQDRSLAALPQGQVTVSGLLREPWKRNLFTPANKPGEGKFYFPDVHEMAEVAGAEPVWIEETMTPDLLKSYSREEDGMPIGRAAEVNLRNNHTQYIFTWYSLSAATAVMMWMLLKKKPSDVTRRVRHNTQW